MLITSMYVWWFSTGWIHLAKTLFAKMGDALSFFSISSLIRTLFAPFRQISATSDNSSRLAAFTDRLVSRFVGATVRLILMIAGLAVFVAEVIVFSVIIVCWPLLPFLPVVGLVLGLSGVMF